MLFWRIANSITITILQSFPVFWDGGSHILLANMLNPKRLICSYDQGLAKPLPTSSHALASRDILCHRHLQIGPTYILKKHSLMQCHYNPYSRVYSKFWHLWIIFNPFGKMAPRLTSLLYPQWRK